MKNHIYVVSRSEFKNEICNLSKQQFLDGAFISIHSPDDHFNHDDTNVILESGPNVLNLWFHDTDPEQEREWMASNPPYPEVLFDENMAQQIKNFVEQNRNADFWLIHCTAGVCRSGAVGEVLSEYFGINYFEFKKDNPKTRPNVYVKILLKNVLNESL